MLRLRSLLLRWLLVPTLLLWVAAVAVGYLHSLGQANEAYDRALLGSALVMAESLHLAGGEVVVELPEAALEMLRTDAQDRVFYRVADGGGRRHITGYEGLPPPAAAREAPAFYDAEYNGQPVRVVAVWQTVLDGAERRKLLVQVAETQEARHLLTRRLVLQSAAMQLLLIALAALVIAFGVRRGLAPLKRLRDEVRRRGANDLTPIDVGAVPREVAPLIDAINTHTERQRQLSEAQLRFVANASHQLKTPLTLLRAQVGEALQQNELQAMRGIVARLDSATEATSRLVGQLLALARSEPGHALPHEELDLTALAHDATFELLRAAMARRIDLGFEGAGPVPVQGDRVLLRELVTNLVHNAVTYIQEGGRVTVWVGWREERPCLRVEDNGPGIPPAERKRVFERFHRSETSATPGSGLGLSIVKEICGRYGIEVTLGEPAAGGRGLCVTLWWPARPGPLNGG
jgi:two-component system sensor histidine kinase TctE